MQKFLTVFGIEAAILVGVLLVSGLGVYAMLWLFLHFAKPRDKALDSATKSSQSTEE
jgi:uncharacterized membrane protein